MVRSWLARTVWQILLVVASLSWFASGATAMAPTPSRGFVGKAGLSEGTSPSSRFDLFQSALRLALQGQEAFERGAYDDAEAFYEESFPLFERALGPEDLRIVGPLAGLADVYRVQGEFDRAELLYRRLLFLMEQAYGPSDIRVGTALASVAEAVAGQGHYGQARELYARAFVIHQAVLGPDDPRTVRVRTEFVRLQGALDQRGEAGGLAAPVGGAGDFMTAVRLGEEGQRRATQGGFGAAEPFFRRALSILDQSVGPESPGVLPVLMDLANACSARGEFGQAASLYRRAREISERAFGREDLAVAGPLDGEAAALAADGQLDPAGGLYRRELAIVEEAFGASNLHVQYVLNQLAESYVKAGRFAEAEPLYRRSLTILEARFGGDHPRVVAFREKYTALLARLGRAREARSQVAPAKPDRAAGDPLAVDR
jgi:tetratricopeptide (TPR) repeat protein